MYCTDTAETTSGLSRAPARSSLASSESFLGGLLRRIAEYLRQQRDYQRLLEMPDHLLRDIGLTRDEVIAAKHRSLF